MNPELALYGNPPSDMHEPRKSDLLDLFNSFAGGNSVNVKAFGARGDGVADDTAAIREALATGGRVFFPRGDYRITGELEVVHAGQILEFETTGGHGYGENVGLNWVPGTRLVSGGAFAKRIRTRRKWRGSASDTQDAPLSCMLNIQAEGVVLLNVCCWLTCDYSDNSPTNLGHDVDVGVFVGTRVGFQTQNLQVIGYFRRAGVYVDVTNGTDLPRFPSLSGTAYPAGTVPNGSDGLHMINPYIRGARQGLAVLGALPQSTAGVGYGADYYDQALGATLPDRRGSFGCSDLCVFGGKIYGPDHHSNRRLYDPTGSGTALAQSAADPDDMPCAIKVDGLAGNASGNLWGMRFYGTRFATFEARRVWLERASRVAFYGCHMEGRNGGRFDTLGNPVDTNNYTLFSFGDISNILGRASRISLFGSNRQSYADGIAPGWFVDADGAPGPTVVTDSGRLFTADYIENDDFRTAEGGDIFFRHGNNTLLEMNAARALLRAPYLAHSGNMDIRAATGSSIALRVGTVTRMVVNGDGVMVPLGALQINGGANAVTLRSGSASPEGLVTANQGSLYMRTGGSAKLWVKETGNGSTGWVQK